MNSIWKYRLELNDESQGLNMPVDARIVHVEMQGGLLCMWAEVNTEEDLAVRHFHVHGTGHSIGSNYLIKGYVGTAMHGPFVWRVYEEAF